jgi:hypothetical protein
MKRISLLLQFCILYFIPVTAIFGQTVLDSVLEQRTKLYEEFRLIHESKGQKT